MPLRHSELLRKVGSLSYGRLWPRVLEACHIAESDLKKVLWKMVQEGRIVLPNLKMHERSVKDHHKIELPAAMADRC